MIKSLKYILSTIGLGRKIAKLEFEKAEVDSEGFPYVKLKNGTCVYGMNSVPKDKKYYKILPSKVKSKLPFECYRVAMDIVIRYNEGGLKYGGPRKEMFNQAKPGDCIAEMGAYMGHYTLYLSEKVGDKGKIIAIEPIPDNLKILRKNIEANGIENVVIVPKGVWKESDEMVFSKKKGDNQSGSIELSYKDKDQLSIPVDSLDNILSENEVDKVDFMLIQLNGVEIEALEGLTKYSPKHLSIAARYKKNDENAAKIIFNMLEERGYKAHIIQDDYVFAELKEN